MRYYVRLLSDERPEAPAWQYPRQSLQRVSRHSLYQKGSANWVQALSVPPSRVSWPNRQSHSRVSAIRTRTQLSARTRRIPASFYRCANLCGWRRIPGGSFCCFRPLRYSLYSLHLPPNTGPCRLTQADRCTSFLILEKRSFLGRVATRCLLVTWRFHRPHRRLASYVPGSYHHVLQGCSTPGRFGHLSSWACPTYIQN